MPVRGGARRANSREGRLIQLPGASVRGRRSGWLAAAGLALLFLAGSGSSALAAGLPPPAAADNPEDPPHGEAPPPLRADTTDVQSEIGDTTMVLRLDGDTLRVPYFSNLLLDAEHPQVRRAVVVVHGTLRNAHTYFHTVESAAALVPGADSTTLIVAPQFLTEADVAADTLPDDHLFWAYMGWRQGDASLSTLLHPRTARISSFSVVDTILARLAERNPNLETIVLAGHSAGGQLVTRYAAGNPIHETLVSEHGLTLRYVFSNPSSYLYFDERRWVPGSAWSFATPSPEQIASCPGYDLYKYGLEQPNEYMDVGAPLLRERYSSRPVVCLLGGADNDPNSTYLERNCEAMLQGEQRLQRGLLFRQHLLDVFGSQILSLHPFAVVPGVGHDHRGIFSSSCGLFHLFDHGSCAPNLPSNAWIDATTEVLRAVPASTATWGDVDADGDPDLFAAASDASDVLLRNDPGAFTDATPGTLRDDRAGMSAAWIDADEDGDLDLAVVNWRAGNRLYRNDGGGGFADVASGPFSDAADQTAAVWGDYDRDGDLDAYLCRINRQPDLLLRNDGEYGFLDVTPAIMTDTTSTRDASWVDYDDDGDLDLYTVVPDGPNRLFSNDDSTFAEITSSPVNQLGPGFSAAWGDYDNDGDLDLYLVNRGIQSRLIRNDGGTFVDVSAPPLTDAGQSRGAAWGDYDNDGDLDLYLVKSPGQNRLFRNNGDGTFADVSEYPVNDGALSYGGAWADPDGDGDLDLYVSNEAGWNKLFRNQAALGRHWLEVELVGAQSNTSGLGARVRVVAAGRPQIREIGSDGSSSGRSWTVAHFGLGAAAVVDTLTVYWPSGLVQTEVNGFPADRRLTVTESTLPAVAGLVAPPRAARLRLAGPNPFSAEIRLVLELATAAAVSAEIHDVTGRRMRHLLRRTLGPGSHTIVWDGRNDRGAPVPSGIYFCRVKGSGLLAEVSVVCLR